MIKYGVLFLVCMVVSLDARINVIDEKFVQYQCQNCRAPLEIQDLLLAQAEAVWEREIVYLCQRCRKEKQKGTTQNNQQSALTGRSNLGNEIVPYEEPIDPFKESALIARNRRIVQEQRMRSSNHRKKNWLRSFLALFSRQTHPVSENESLNSDSASSFDTQPSEGSFEFAQFAGRFFSARQGSHELGVTFPWSDLNGRRFVDLPGNIKKIVDFDGCGFLVVLDNKKKPLFWYSEHGLKEYSEKVIQDTVKDHIMRERIKSYDLKYHISSKQEHDAFLQADKKMHMKHNHDYEYPNSDLSDNEVELPHIYERVQSDPDYQTLYPEIPARPHRPVNEPYSLTYERDGKIHTDV